MAIKAELPEALWGTYLDPADLGRETVSGLGRAGYGKRIEGSLDYLVPSKPLQEVPDEELLLVRNIGRKRLQDLRDYLLYTPRD